MMDIRQFVIIVVSLIFSITNSVAYVIRLPLTFNTAEAAEHFKEFVTNFQHTLPTYAELTNFQNAHDDSSAIDAELKAEYEQARAKLVETDKQHVAMIGYSMFVKADGGNAPCTVYAAMKLRDKIGDRSLAPVLNRDRQLFQVGATSHTERQLALVTLLNAVGEDEAALIGGINAQHDQIIASAAYMPLHHALGIQRDPYCNVLAGGTLHIYTEQPPCISNTSGDMCCIDYWNQLADIFTNVNLNVYFPNKDIGNGMQIFKHDRGICASVEHYQIPDSHDLSTTKMQCSSTCKTRQPTIHKRRLTLLTWCYDDTAANSCWHGLRDKVFPTTKKQWQCKKLMSQLFEAFSQNPTYTSHYYKMHFMENRKNIIITII